MAAFSSLSGLAGTSATRRPAGAIGSAAQQGATLATTVGTPSTVGTPNQPQTPNPYPFALAAAMRQRTRTTLSQKTRTRQAAGNTLASPYTVKQKPGLTATSPGAGFGRSLFTGAY